MKRDHRFAKISVHIGLALAILSLVVSSTLNVSAMAIPLVIKEGRRVAMDRDPDPFPEFYGKRGSATGPAVTALSNVRVTVTDIGPEFGSSFSVAGFIINREIPRQVLLPTSTRIFRSFNGGAIWSPADLISNRGFADGTFYVRQDPGNPQRLFAVKSFFSGVTEAGVYRSDNFGTTWTRLAGGFFDPIDLTINEASSNVLLVLNKAPFEEDALWRSEDGGSTFEPQPESGLPKAIFDEDTGDFLAAPFYTNVATTPADPDVVYVVLNMDEVGFYPSSIYKSVDGGLTFTRLEGSPPRPLQVFPHPTDPNVLFVQDEADSPNIYRSADGGVSFQPLTTGLPPDKFNYFVALDAHNPSFVYVAGDGGLFRSTDGGNTFQPLGLTAEQLGLAATTASVDPSNPNIIYVNTNRGNFKSLNGGHTFHSINSGWKAAGARHIAFDNASSPNLYVAAANGIGILKTKTHGNHYEHVSHPPELFSTGLLAIAPTDAKTIFAATGASLFRTIDGGTSWSRASIDTTDVFFSNTGSEIAVDPLNPNNVYFVTSSFFGTPGFYRSTNAGLTFQQTNIDPEIDQRFSDLGIDPVNPSVIYTGTNPFPGMDFGPLRSVDGGLNFANGPITRAGIRDIAIDPINSSNVYLTGGFHLSGGFENHVVLRSTDGGVTYVAAESGLEDPSQPLGFASIIGMVIDPQDPARLYLWTRKGLFMTSDRGATWSLIEADETVKAAGYGNTIAIDPKNPNRLYLAGASIFEVEIRD